MRRRSWPLVAQREIQVKLTDRNFLISTGVTLVLIIGLMVMQAWLGGMTQTSTVAVADDEAAAVVSQAEELLVAEDDLVEVEQQRVTDAEAGRAAVTEGEADAFLTRTDAGWQIAAEGAPPSAVHRALTDVISTAALEQNATEAGISLAELQAGATLTVQDVSEDDADEEAQGLYFIVGLAFAFLFYFASVMFGMSIASSVVEEKQSRIVEILAAAIPIRQLLTGKVVGTTLLALGQLLLIVGVMLIGLTFTDYDVFLAGMGGAIAWYVPFFLAGFLALACIWAAAGAMASRVEDLQSTTTPLTMALVAIFLVGLSLDGVWEQIGSFVPVLSTILMPMRILAGETQWWEPALALLVTLAFAAATVAMGSRLYRRALLHTQGRLGWRTAWRTGD